MSGDTEPKAQPSESVAPVPPEGTALCLDAVQLLRMWHEAWKAGDEGDSLDAPTVAFFARVPSPATPPTQDEGQGASPAERAQNDALDDLNTRVEQLPLVSRALFEAAKRDVEADPAAFIGPLLATMKPHQLATVNWLLLEMRRASTEPRSGGDAPKKARCVVHDCSVDDTEYAEIECFACRDVVVARAISAEHAKLRAVLAPLKALEQHWRRIAACHAPNTADRNVNLYCANQLRDTLPALLALAEPPQDEEK